MIGWFVEHHQVRLLYQAAEISRGLAAESVSVDFKASLPLKMPSKARSSSCVACGSNRRSHPIACVLLAMDAVGLARKERASGPQVTRAHRSGNSVPHRPRTGACVNQRLYSVVLPPLLLI